MQIKKEDRNTNTCTLPEERKTPNVICNNPKKISKEQGFNREEDIQRKENKILVPQENFNSNSQSDQWLFCCPFTNSAL